MKKILLPFMAIIVFITTGCSPITPKYRVTIDAITAPNIPVVASSYVIDALGKETDVNGLRFQEQAKVLTQLLNIKGYTKSSNGSPDQTIYFDYGIEKIKETESYSEPSITFSTSWGYPYGYYGRHYHPYNNFWYGGERTYRQTYTYYNRYVTIISKSSGNKELWRVDVSSIGESKNLRKIIPLLIKASEPFIGKNTEEPVKLVIKGKIDKKE